MGIIDKMKSLDTTLVIT